MIITCVSALILVGHPSAVFWTIVPVDINPIDAVPDWWFPHVRSKKLKVIPPRTYLYSPASIVLVPVFIGITAPLSHRQPYPINAWANSFTIDCLADWLFYYHFSFLSFRFGTLPRMATTIAGFFVSDP